MLAMSVAVVRKILEAVAGSKPSFFSVSGIMAPATPLTTQLAIMASSTANPRCSADGLCWRSRRDIHADGGHEPHEHAVEKSERGFLGDQPSLGAFTQFAERHAAQRDGQRLAAGIARLAGENWEKQREDHEFVQRALKHARPRLQPEKP